MERTTAHEDRCRAAFMQYLYDRSGRTNGLFTGLWQQFKDEMALDIRNKWFAIRSQPHESLQSKIDRMMGF
jgi:hypothetical protein